MLLLLLHNGKHILLLVIQTFLKLKLNMENTQILVRESFLDILGDFFYRTYLKSKQMFVGPTNRII